MDRRGAQKVPQSTRTLWEKLEKSLGIYRNQVLCLGPVARLEVLW